MRPSLALAARARLVLFTGQHCSLCVHFKRQLAPCLDGLPLEEVDIKAAGKEEWWEKYKYDIPVLHVDGREVLRHRFDEDVFRKALADSPPQ